MSFDTINNVVNRIEAKGLNPFRAGRCLSTTKTESLRLEAIVSIPFEQGDVFRQTNGNTI